ncbi:MAG: SurA N-terminal domain-containing protein [Deltaproteobacteria bacterium]|nr:SurA N-terminal domain-containing protein [Deltaproteobacteria bacterium]
MLSVFRNNKRNVLNWVIFGAITFVFVFTFGSWGGGNVSGEVPTAATVDGRVIPRSQFQTSYSNYYQQMASRRPGYSPEMAREEGLADTVLDRLISNELLAQAAEARGITVPDDEIAKVIEEQFFGGKGKSFDADEYKRIVNGLYGTSEARFEEQLRRDLMAERMRQILADSQHVADAEIRERFEAQNNRADIEFVRVDPNFFKKGMSELSDADAKAWAAANKADVEKFYGEHMNRYRQPKRVKARHILVKAAEDAPQADKDKAKAKLEEAIKRLDGGEDFAKVAKEVSEDTSGKDGGDLGWFGPGAMVKPFEDAAFALVKGKRSGVVESRYGYHVIQVDDVQDPVTKEIADVEVEIAKQLGKERQQKAAARKVADAVLAELKAGTGIDALKTPDVIKAPAAGQPPPKPGEVDPFAPRADSTGFFSQDARVIPKVGVSTDLVKIAFALTKEAPVHPEIVEVNNRLFAVRLKAREQVDPAKFLDERAAIESMLLAGRRIEVVEAAVKAMRARARIEKDPNLMATNAQY